MPTTTMDRTMARTAWTSISALKKSDRPTLFERRDLDASAAAVVAQDTRGDSAWRQSNQRIESSNSRFRVLKGVCRYHF